MIGLSGGPGSPIYPKKYGKKKKSSLVAKNVTQPTTKSPHSGGDMIDMSRLLEPSYLSGLLKGSKISMGSASAKKTRDNEKLELYGEYTPSTTRSIGKTSKVLEDERRKSLAELPQRLSRQIVRLDSSTTDEANINLSMGQAALHEVLGKLQKFRSVIVRKRQLAKVGDIRWTSVKQQLVKRSQNERKKNLGKRPIETRIAVEMALQMLKFAEAAGPTQVAVALSAAMTPLKKIMTELPELLKKDSAYRATNTGLFDQIEDFLCRVFQGKIKIHEESRHSVLSSVGSMLLQLGVSRQSARVLVRLCHTVLCDGGALSKLPLDTLGVQALIEVSSPPTLAKSEKKKDNLDEIESQGPNLMVSSDRRTVTHNANDVWDYAVGSRKVTAGKHRWKVKLDPAASSHTYTSSAAWTAKIGVVPSEMCTPIPLAKDDAKVETTLLTFVGASLKPEVVTVELDMDARTLTFERNGIWEGSVQKLKTTKAVCLCLKLKTRNLRASILQGEKPVLQGSLKVWGKLDSKTEVSRRGHVVHTADGASPLKTMCESMYKHGLAVDHQGVVFGWGDASQGALGPKLIKSVCTPQRLQLSFQGTVVAVGCGSAFSAAVTNDGKFFMWGHVNLMKESKSTSLSAPRLIAVPEGMRAREVACGFNFTLVALEKEGTGVRTLYSFGKNNKGQLGINSTVDSNELKQVNFQNASKQTPNIVSFACGWFHALAASRKGQLFSWGGAVSGNKPVCGLGYGDGKDTPQLTPQRVKSMMESRVVKVVCGHDHSMCVDSSGRAWSWGSNEHGQLGNGEIGVDRPFPTLLTPAFLPPVKLLAGGKAHSAAVTTGGALYCWGQLEKGWAVDVGATSNVEKDSELKDGKDEGKCITASPQLVCANRCYAASCFNNGHILALCQSASFNPGGKDGVGSAPGKTRIGWQETGLEPFRPDPSLKNSTNLIFREEGDAKERIRVICNNAFPDRCAVFSPVLSSGCFEVEFKIERAQNISMDIGVLPADNKMPNWRSQYLYLNGYSLSSWGNVYARNVVNHSSPWNTSAAVYRPGDTVRLKLDMDKRQMWVAVNDGDMLKCSDNIPSRVMVGLGLYNINCEVLVTPLSSMDSSKVRFLRGSSLYAPLWTPNGAQEILSRANGNTESAGDAVLAVMRSIAELCGQQSYPAQVPSILGAPALLTVPLCVDGKGPEMLEQLVEMAERVSGYLVAERKTSLPPPLNTPENASFMMLSVLRVVRANLHRVLLSGVDQRWLQLTVPFTNEKLHPWREKGTDSKQSRECGDELHFLQRLHIILAKTLLGEYHLPQGAESALIDEAARIISLSVELLYPKTGERLEMVSFLLDEKFRNHPLVRALRVPMLESFHTDRLCTLLIPEPIKIPRRLRMATGEEAGMSAKEEDMVEKDKARFKSEADLLVKLLSKVASISVKQGRDLISSLSREAKEGKKKTLKPHQRFEVGVYMLKPGMPLTVQRTLELDSAEVAKLKPLTKIRVVEIQPWKDTDIVRGRISEPHEGWVSLLDMDKTVYWVERTPQLELELLYALHRHTLTWAAAYTKVVANLDKMDLPEGAPDIDVTVALESGEVCIVTMNRKDRIASLKEKVAMHLPDASGPPDFPKGGMELHLNGKRLNDEHTLESCGIDRKSRLTQKTARVPSLKRTLSAFKPRSKEQAKASLIAAKAVEDAMRIYSERIFEGCFLLCDDIKKLYENQLKSGIKYSMQMFRAMDMLKKILGAVGGPLVLTALSSSESIEALPNTLKLSQDSVQNLIAAISPLVPVAVPVMPSKDTDAKSARGQNAKVIFDHTVLAPHVKLSNGNLTAEKNKGNNGRWNTVRLSQWMSRNSGKHSFDFIIESSPSQWIFIGCASEQFNKWQQTSNSYLGCGSGSWGFSMGGGSNSATRLYGSQKSKSAYNYNKPQYKFTTGDRITVHIDTDAHTISFDKNNVPIGVAFTGINYQNLAAGVTLYNIGDRVTFAPRDSQMNTPGPAISSKEWRIRAESLPNDAHAVWKLSRVEVFSDPGASKSLAAFDVKGNKLQGTASNSSHEVKVGANGVFQSGFYAFEFKLPVAVKAVVLTNHANGRTVQHFTLDFKDEQGKWREAEAFTQSRYSAQWSQLKKKVTAVDLFAPDYWAQTGVGLRLIGGSGYVFGPPSKDPKHKKTITSKSKQHSFASAVGAHSFSNGYREWKIKVDKFQSIEGMVGVAGSGFTNFERPMTERGCFAYVASGRKTDPKQGDAKYGKPWKTGDVITVCLDLDRHTLSFKLNDENLGVSHDKLPKGAYRLACSVGQSTTVLTIVDVPRPEDSEQKKSVDAKRNSEPLVTVMDDELELPWGPTSWLSQLQALLGTSLCEVISQRLTAYPVDPAQRLAALKQLHKMLAGVTKAREQDDKVVLEVWTAGLTEKEESELDRALAKSNKLRAKASIESLGKDNLSGSSPTLLNKIERLRKTGGMSSAMQRGLLRCMLVSLEGGLLTGLEGKSKDNIGKELVSMMHGVTKTLADLNVGASERLLALKIWTSLMAKQFLGLAEMKSSGVFKILQDTLHNSTLPAAKLPLVGSFSELREKVMFEATVFEVFRIWVAMAAQDEKALEEAGIVKFILSELTRLSPTVVSDGKEKLRLQEKKRANLKEIDRSKDQVKYAEELTQLNYMGFVNMAQNLLALKASSGNVQAAVDKLLSGKPIKAPASTSSRAPVAVLPSAVLASTGEEAMGGGGDNPSLSLWVDTSKLQLPVGREKVLAYRGTEKAGLQYQPMNNQHRWLPRLTFQGSGEGKFRVNALVSCGNVSTNYVLQQRIGGAKEYEMDGGMMHVAFLVEAKQVSLYVNGQVDSTRMLTQTVWSPSTSLELKWGDGVIGYEAPWYAVASNKVMWLEAKGATDFNDHYASVLLGLFNWLPPRQLVSGSREKRPKRPTNLSELLSGAQLTRYAGAFENAGYDDFDFVMSLSADERNEFYETVMMAKEDQDRYESYLKALNPPASTLANFVGMLLAGSPKVQLVIVRLLQRMLRYVPPEAFDDVMETKATDEAPAGSRLISVLGTIISNVLWAPYDNTIISHPQLAASIPVAMEVMYLLRQLIAETGESDQDSKSKDQPPLKQWSHAVKTYLTDGLSELKELVQRLRPLNGEGGEWDDAVIYAGSMRKALESLYVLCGATVCGVFSMSLQSALTDYHYYYYGLSPFGKKIAEQLEEVGTLQSRDINDSKANSWSLGNEVAKMLDYVVQLTLMYGTLTEDNRPPYTALEFNLVRLWLITGIPPRGVERVKTYKQACDAFKKYEAKRNASKAGSHKSQYWAAGTGYGHGSNAQDTARVRKMQREHEERERKKNAEVFSILNAVLVQLNSKIDEAFIRALAASSVLPWLIALLKQTSTLDMQKNIDKYDVALDVVDAMAAKEQLTFLFLPGEDDSKQSLKSVLLDQKNSSEMLLKFTGQKIGQKMNALLSKILKVYKKVASAVRSHKKKQDSETAAAAAGKDAKEQVVQKKLVAGTAHLSKVYGWVDEKNYCSLLKPRLFAEMPDFKMHHYRKGSYGSKTSVSANWTNRLGAELVGLSKSLPLNPNSSVFFRCCAKNMAFAKMIIAAPPSTPYGYGLFLFDVYFPTQYPNVAPKVNLMTTGRASVRFNPNLYNCGKVCLSLLGTWQGSPEEMWQPNQSTFLQVCVSIQSLIFIEHPYFNEPGYESSMKTSHGMQKSRAYNAIRETATVQWAMLDMLKNPPPGFEHVVKAHFYLQQKNICQQIEKWLKLPEHKSGQLKTYYNQLKEEFAKLKEPEIPDADEDEDDDDDDDF